MAETVWTSNRKEAYEFAKLLTVVDGIEDVFVSVTSEAFQFQVFFDYNNKVHEHSLFVELYQLLKEYELNGINLHGEKWARAKDEVEKESL
ncbi:hypothetical protein PY093_11085 [Cytobacillus sp. S13-E01]|uniref:hypothetical protein n=1 Tax=Cytobacillus sp. S13-E01 TaxID=3031326 RepID=UPI0023D84E13|nr:hypothetical protein [Cytobacillus sp. S13-E01]MDF0727242.1 hypothetical protein [Cytobacillus sp. S13-E01]